jgi:hypothetical protein
MSGGIEALKASVAPGPPPVKSEAALRVALPLLAEPSPSARTGRSPGCAAKSWRVRACRSAARNCPSHCVKKLGWQNELATDPAFRRFRLEVPMARTSIRERPDREEVLWPVQKACPACGTPMRLRYDNGRTLVTLAGPVRLRLKIRRCEGDDCARHHRPYRPEAEGAMALPGHEFGLDVIVLVGRLRHREHRSVPEIHKRLREQGVAIAERSVTNLLDRYDELLAMTNCWRRRWATALGCGNGWRPRGG